MGFVRGGGCWYKGACPWKECQVQAQLEQAPGGGGEFQVEEPQGWPELGLQGWAVPGTFCSGDEGPPLCGRHVWSRGGRTPRDTPKSFPLHFLFSGQQGLILEKLRICSMPQFVHFVHDLLPFIKDPDVVVTDLLFGTIPVKLYQPRRTSRSLRPGILLFHGGGGIVGSFSKSPPLRPGLRCDRPSSVGGSHLPA